MSSLVPAWVSNLGDSIIRDLLEAAFTSDGPVTEASMSHFFAHLAAELPSTGLTTQQVADLGTIDLELGHAQGVGFDVPSYVEDSPYVAYLINAVIQGFADDAEVSNSPLGLGTTGTQLNELVNSWFNGNDLPSESREAAWAGPGQGSGLASGHPLTGAVG
jgi:hypothetical protein